MYAVTTLPIPTPNVQGSVTIEQQRWDMSSGCEALEFTSWAMMTAVLVTLIEETYCDPQKKDRALSIMATEVYNSLESPYSLDGLLIGVQLCLYPGVSVTFKL